MEVIFSPSTCEVHYTYIFRQFCRYFEAKTWRIIEQTIKWWSFCRGGGEGEACKFYLGNLKDTIFLTIEKYLSVSTLGN